MSLDLIKEIPVLPLPDTVLFPRTLAPVTVQEKRYKQLVSYAIENRREVGVALLRPGWENDYYDTPAIFQVGALAVISENERTGPGDWRILLQGVQRFSVIEFKQLRPYRIARVRLLDDPAGEPEDWERHRMSRQLIRYFREMSRAAGPGKGPTRLLSKLDFPALVNSICASLNFSIYEKQRLLELNDLQDRAHSILEILRTQVGQLRLISRFRHLEPEDSRSN